MPQSKKISKKVSTLEKTTVLYRSTSLLVYSGAIADPKQSAPPSNSNSPATSKGGPSVPSPVLAPVGAPSSATSTGGPTKLMRQTSSTGGPSDTTHSATSIGGQASASMEKPDRPQLQLAPAPGGVYAAIAKYRKAARSAPFLLPGGVRVSSHYSSLFTPGDNRPGACFTDFRFSDKQSWMYSFNPSTLRCNCCTDRTLNSERGERRAGSVTFSYSQFLYVTKFIPLVQVSLVIGGLG